MYLRDFFVLKPFHDYSLCWVCILPQPAFYSQSAVGILHTVCILPLVRSLQSAVRSLRLTLTDKEMLSLWWQVNLEAFGIMLEIQLLEKVKTKNFERRKIKPVSTRIQRSETCNDCLNWIVRHFKTFPFHRSDQTRIVRRMIYVHAGWKFILYSLSCNASMITEYGKNMLVYTAT